MQSCLSSGDAAWNGQSLVTPTRPSWDTPLEWRTITIDLTQVDVSLDPLNPQVESFANRAMAARFVFGTLDDLFNAHEGWYIDDIRIGPLAEPMENGATHWTNGAETVAERNSMLMLDPTNQTFVPEWHPTMRRSNSGAYSWWFGNEATGTYEASPDPVPGTGDFPPLGQNPGYEDPACQDGNSIGVLTTPVIKLGDNPVLTFRTAFEIESILPDVYDSMFVQIAEDTDEDGLLDVWEVAQAVDYNEDGLPEVALPGADMNHKDVYVEIDCMGGNTCPKPTTMIWAANALSAVPVDNPDGTPGINLHYEIGSIPPHPGLELRSAEFAQIKEDNFFHVRRCCYHYSVWSERPTAATWMGVSELHGNDHIIAIGQIGSLPTFFLPSYDFFGSPVEQATSFVHELGHSLGLTHGGSDHVNGKPNVMSLMNYSFSNWGVPPFAEINGDGLGNDDGTCNPTIAAPEDCVGNMRYSAEILSYLPEVGLIEWIGLPGNDNTTNLHTTWHCPDGTTRSVPPSSQMDWNCDGTIDVLPVAVDINGNGRYNLLSPGNNMLQIDLIFGDNCAFGIDGATIDCAPPTLQPTSSDYHAANIPTLRRLGNMPDADYAEPTVAVQAGLTGPNGYPALQLTITDNAVTDVGIREIDIIGASVISPTQFIELPPTAQATVLVESLNTQQPTFSAFVSDWAGNIATLNLGTNPDSVPPRCALINHTADPAGVILDIWVSEETAFNGGAPTLTNATHLSTSEYVPQEEVVLQFQQTDPAQPMIVTLDVPDLSGNLTTCTFTETSQPLDGDSDTVPDVIDNCPFIGNSTQIDSNSDGVGDACTAIVVGDVTGQPQANATADVLSAGLTLGNVYTTSHVVPVGDVVAQFPVSGTVVSALEPVDLVVSIGILAPDVISMTQAEAENVLGQHYLTLGTVTTANSDTVPFGRIISQSPAPNNGMNPLDPVDLVVSRGIAVPVPDLSGQTVPTATVTLTNARLTLGITTTASSTQTVGIILDQSPPPGTIVDETSPVDVVVSLGDLTTVPTLIGLQRTDADAAIVDAGLFLNSVVTRSHTAPFGQVISQTLPAGQVVANNTNIGIEVSFGDLTIVPNVVGLLRGAAEASLLNNNLTVGNIAEVVDTNIVSGTVTAQSVPPSSTVNLNFPVDLTVAIGSQAPPPTVTVPAVVGILEADAINTLSAANLIANVVPIASTLPPGMVIFQFPAAATDVLAGSMVTIWVTQPTAAFQISKQGTSTIEAGADINYTINYASIGQLDATNALIRDTLPTHTFFAAAQDGGTYDASTRTVTWQMGDLPTGANGSVSFVATAPCNGVTFVRNANYSMSADNAPFAFGSPVDTTITPALTHAVSLTITSAPESGSVVHGGDRIIHILTLDNTANSDRFVRIPLSSGSPGTFDGFLDIAGGRFQQTSPYIGTWFGTVPANGTLNVVLATRVPDPLETVQATVSLNNGTPIDVYNGCNFRVGTSLAPLALTLQRPIEASIVATTLNPPALENQIVRTRYQLARENSIFEVQFVLTNVLTATQSTVSVTLPLPQGIMPVTTPPFNNPTSPGASYEAATNSVHWQGSMAAGETRTVTFDVQLDATAACLLPLGVGGNTVPGINDISAIVSILVVPQVPNNGYLLGLDQFQGAWIYDPIAGAAPREVLCMPPEIYWGIDALPDGRLAVAGLPAFTLDPNTLVFDIMDTRINIPNRPPPIDVAMAPDGSAYFLHADQILRYDASADTVTLVAGLSPLGAYRTGQIDATGRFVGIVGSTLIRFDTNAPFPIDPTTFEVLDTTIDASFGNPLGTFQWQAPREFSMAGNGDYVTLVDSNFFNDFGNPSVPPLELYDLYSTVRIDPVSGNRTVLDQITTYSRFYVPDPPPPPPAWLQATSPLDMLNGSMAAADTPQTLYIGDPFTGALSQITLSPTSTETVILPPDFNNLRAADLVWVNNPSPTAVTARFVTVQPLNVVAVGVVLLLGITLVAVRHRKPI